MMPCPECGGAGYLHYDINGNRISRRDYYYLPTDCREREMCNRCGGEGAIEDTTEPDYDHYDD